jgi:hypothetical protein
MHPFVQESFMIDARPTTEPRAARSPRQRNSLRLVLLLCFLLLFMLLPGGSKATDSIRRDGELVSVGDTKLTLLRVMGQPDYQEVITHAVDTGKGLSEEKRPEKEEIWYYFGVNGLDYSIHLINSRITRIEWERTH